MPKEPFTKPPLSNKQHVEKLKQRGLAISDELQAEHYLRFISYYRFTPYFRMLQVDDSPDHAFVADARFEDVLRLYIFDRELRLLFLDPVERIEVAVRTCISNEMCETHGAHWFMDSHHFSPKFKHAAFLGQIEKETGFSNQSRQTVFSEHYYRKYSTPDLPPCWMVAEVLSFGTWSTVYEHLADPAAKLCIAKHFRLRPTIFESWLMALSFLRNVCAHHSLLWNRIFTKKPKQVIIDGAEVKQTSTLYAQAAVIQRLLKAIAPHSAWSQRLGKLLKDYPEIPMEKMGFHEGWTEYPFWKH